MSWIFSPTTATQASVSLASDSAAALLGKLPWECWAASAGLLGFVTWLVVFAIRDFRRGSWWGFAGLACGALGSAATPWAMRTVQSLVTQAA